MKATVWSHGLREGLGLFAVSPVRPGRNEKLVSLSLSGGFVRKIVHQGNSRKYDTSYLKASKM